MSEIPFDPADIPEAGSDAGTLETEKFEEFDAKELDTGETAVVEAPDGGELSMEGLGPCIGLVGYDREREIIFAKHFMFTHPIIDQEVSEFLEDLRKNGTNPTETAVAGGNLSYEEQQRDPAYFTQMTQAKERLVQSGVVTRSYVDAQKLTESTRADNLSVSYTDGKFKISFGESHVEEARSGPF
ncbi:MAG: hypothetical protein WD187_02735 [Candidatus Woykebacteria bacterium]